MGKYAWFIVSWFVPFFSCSIRVAFSFAFFSPFPTNENEILVLPSQMGWTCKRKIYVHVSVGGFEMALLDDEISCGEWGECTPKPQTCWVVID